MNIAGGMENMSLAPYLLSKGRNGLIPMINEAAYALFERDRHSRGYRYQ